MNIIIITIIIIIDIVVVGGGDGNRNRCLKPYKPLISNPIYQPLRLSRIWHKVNFLSGV